MSLTTFLLGRRLANREGENRKIGAIEGVPAMGLDGLGSASYGPEAMLAVLAVSGSAGLQAVRPLTLAIIVLLVILFVSYWQTIKAYPSNGGCYTVARENLGETAGLLAAAALMVDYLLNVAVGVSAGVGALTSAVPALHAYTLELCLVILAVITLINLRGTKESGVALAAPTYLFVASLLILIGLGVYATLTHGGHPPPVVKPPAVEAAGALPLWLVLRAFAAGCTAMTGVEAVSNGVGAFKEPTVKHAHRTLTAICLILGALLAGIAILAHSYGVMAMDQNADGYQSVLSQLTAAVVGRSWFYYVTIGSVLAVLCLSANTSFVGFPRLCRNVADDGYLPKAFAVPGRRLVYTVGVLFLSGGAGLVLIAFNGITDKLIPLFAVGAFLAFTSSQAGMAAHWARNRRGRVDHIRLGINGVGALTTGAALAIIILAKFTEGAWLTVLIIPPVVVLLKVIKRYYVDLDRQVLRGSRRTMDLRDRSPPMILIPLERWDRMARNAVQAAAGLSPEIFALHLIDLQGPEAVDHEAELRADWTRFVEHPVKRAGLPGPQLIVERTPYRSMVAPVLRKVGDLRRAQPHRPIVVILHELVGGQWWRAVLHTRRTQRLRVQILRYAGPGVSVLILPWQLDLPEVERMMAEEEPQAT